MRTGFIITLGLVLLIAGCTPKYHLTYGGKLFPQTPEADAIGPLEIRLHPRRTECATWRCRPDVALQAVAVVQLPSGELLTGPATILDLGSTTTGSGSGAVFTGATTGVVMTSNTYTTDPNSLAVVANLAGKTSRMKCDLALNKQSGTGVGRCQAPNNAIFDVQWRYDAKGFENREAQWAHLEAQKALYGTYGAYSE